MRVTLLRDSRILHHAGETVEVSPTEAGHLLSLGSAVPADDEKPAEKPSEKPATRRSAKK